jgi:hypothetical protein
MMGTRGIKKKELYAEAKLVQKRDPVSKRG